VNPVAPSEDKDYVKYCDWHSRDYVNRHKWRGIVAQQNIAVTRKLTALSSEDHAVDWVRRRDPTRPVHGCVPQKSRIVRRQSYCEY